MPRKSDETLNEAETRQLIDRQLVLAAWQPKYIKEEINSIKSKFKEKDYVPKAAGIEKGVDHFIDYLLLAEDESVLALIEAKKFSKDPEKGRIQARTYAKDIQKQTGEPVLIFLSNGRKWKVIDYQGQEREIKGGVWSQGDIKRRRELARQHQSLLSLKRSNIIDRPRSRQIVQALCEHFETGQRAALIIMATGTGKTRVAMALIDSLKRAGRVLNVLFVADRTALANQAKEDGFKKFFTEPVGDLRDGYDQSKRFYVTTVQSLMAGEPRLYQRISPAYFDLVIYDEAHRSYYDKNNQVIEYFDAIKVGLTATPREHEAHNTYKLFGCDPGKPTIDYNYDEALIDKVLVPYHAEIIGTEVLTLGIKGKALSSDLQDQLRRQEENPENIEFHGSEFARQFMDRKTNELVIHEFMRRCYKSDDGKPCKSIFFCVNQNHAHFVKETFDHLYPLLSSNVQDITSEMYRSDDEVNRFKKEDEPRICISVGMLDSGVDVPEVCNLVFVKPVFSSIRFWQMLGRGTRNLEACKHPEWLPNREKHDFHIFDFKIGGFSNVEEHELQKSPEREPGLDTVSRIFLNRIHLLERPLTNEQRSLVIDKLLSDISALNEDSYIVREKLPLLQRLKANPQELSRHIEELKYDVVPLMIIRQGYSAETASFIITVEKLFRYVLDRDKNKIDEIRAFVSFRLQNIMLRDNLHEIAAKKASMRRALQEKFWDDLTFNDVDWLISEFAELMKYFEPERTRILDIDKPDVLLEVTVREKEVKEDEQLKEFVAKSPLIAKIKGGIGLTAPELFALEEQLRELRPELTIENLQRYHRKDFLKFLHEIIGLTREYDPQELIRREFDKHILEHHHYNSRQLEFLHVLRNVFAERKRLEIQDLGEFPLADEHPLESFQFAELQSIVEKVNSIKMK